MLVSREILGFLFIRVLRQYLAHFQSSSSSDCYPSVSRTLRIPFHPLGTFVFHALLCSFSSECFVGILRPFTVLLHPSVKLVSRALVGFLFIPVLRYYLALLGFFFIRVLSLYLAHLLDSFSSECYVIISRALLGFFFIRVLRQYLVHFWNSFSSGCYVSISRIFQDFFSSECYVSISCTFRVHLHPIVTLVFHVLLGFLFNRVLRQYLAHFWDSFSSEYDVSISCTFRISVHLIITLVSRTLLEFCLFNQEELLRFCSIGLLRQCLACFDSRVILWHSIITYVSRMLRQYLAHFLDSLPID